jgi:hypothetical protein
MDPEERRDRRDAAIALRIGDGRLNLRIKMVAPGLRDEMAMPILRSQAEPAIPVVCGVRSIGWSSTVLPQSIDDRPARPGGVDRGVRWIARPARSEALDGAGSGTSRSAGLMIWRTEHRPWLSRWGCSAMNDELICKALRGDDRRRRPTSPIDALFPDGRRQRPRREEERQGPYFVDRFHAATLGMVVALLGLTLIDGILTLELIELNSEEANPIMAHMLSRGGLTFLVSKYIMTAAGLPFLVVYQHYPLFRSRFRVGWLLPVFISLYLVLLLHQWNLFQIGRADALRDRPTGQSRPDGGYRLRLSETARRAPRVPATRPSTSPST